MAVTHYIYIVGIILNIIIRLAQRRYFRISEMIDKKCRQQMARI